MLVHVGVTAGLVGLAGCGDCGAGSRANLDAGTAADTAVVAADTRHADARKAYVPPKRPPLAAPHRILKRPRNQAELPTTDWASYSTNVRGQMKSTRAAFKAAPVSPASRRQVGWRVYTWAELHQDPAHYAEVVEIASGGDAALPGAELLLMRAEGNFGLGRAKEALADLAGAEIRGSKSRRIQSLRAELQWHLNRDEAAQKAMRDELAARPGVHVLGRVGQMEWELGNVEEAERLFATAETKITNTAPAPVAWLSVQRGLLHLEQGRTDEALKFLRAAHERGTGYPMAIAALSRGELTAGNPGRAIELMEPLVRDWPQPGHQLLLAQAYKAADRSEDALRTLADAGRACEGLYPKYKEAVAADCAEVAIARGNSAGARTYGEAAVASSPSRANRARLAAMMPSAP